MLGIEISQTAVAKDMPRQQQPPSQTLRAYLENHLKDLVPVESFTVPSAAFQALFVFVALPGKYGLVRPFLFDHRSVIRLAVTFGLENDRRISGSEVLLSQSTAGVLARPDPYHLTKSSAQMALIGKAAVERNDTGCSLRSRQQGIEIALVIRHPEFSGLSWEPVNGPVTDLTYEEENP